MSRRGEVEVLVDDAIDHAATVIVDVCSCPSVRLVLLDGDGAPFAVAGFTPESWAGVVADAQRKLASAKKDTIGACAGHG